MNVADRAAEDASGLLDRAFQTVKLLNLDVEQPDHLGSSREWRVLERKQVRISWLLPIGKKQIEILTFNFRDLYFGDSIPGEFQMITKNRAKKSCRQHTRVCGDSLVRIQFFRCENIHSKLCFFTKTD